MSEVPIIMIVMMVVVFGVTLFFFFGPELSKGKKEKSDGKKDAVVDATSESDPDAMLRKDKKAPEEWKAFVVSGDSVPREEATLKPVPIKYDTSLTEPKPMWELPSTVVRRV
jgi:hypothetical protein